MYIPTRRIIAVLGWVVLVGIIGIALFAPLVAPFDPYDRIGKPFSPPDALYILGTNDVGQDILSELIHGTRTSLLVGITAAIMAIGLGTLVGIISGFYGGLLDSVLMRLADVVLILPFLPLLIVLAAFLGPSLVTIVGVVGLLSWARPARVIRAHVLTIRTLPYLEAGRALGAGSLWLVWRHIFPAVIPLAFAQLLLAASSTILVEASLSFLGLGDPTVKSWGTMLYYAQARSAFLNGSWLWWVIPPGICIALTVLSLAFIGVGQEKQ